MNTPVVNTRAIAGTLCLLACIAASTAFAQQPATTQSATMPAGQDGVLAELEQLQTRLRQVQDLTTRFTQEKHTPLLRKPMISTGEIRIIGNLMRWDTQKPTRSIMLIGEKEIRLYYPKQKLMEVYRLDQQMAKMAASPIPRLDVMKDEFYFARLPAGEIMPGADDNRYLGVRLTPQKETLKQHIQQVRLLIDRESAYLRQMEMVDADGERTVINFEDVKLNTGLKAADLELSPPAGTRISHPLSGEDGQ